MNAKAKFVIKTLLEYGLLGPLFGGVLVIIALSLFAFKLELEVVGIILVVGYVCGLIPALITGGYVAARAVKSRPIHLLHYYAIAALISLLLNPFFVFSMYDTLQHPGKADSELLTVTALPLLAGVGAAFLMLKLVQTFNLSRPFALQFSVRNPSPAVSEV